MRHKSQIKALGNHLRELRQAKGFTQAELANRMGKDRQSYQRVEYGTVNTSFSYLLEIAEVLEVPFTDLFSFMGSDKG